MLDDIPGAKIVLDAVHVSYICLVLRRSGGSLSPQEVAFSASLPPCTIIPGTAVAIMYEQRQQGPEPLTNYAHALCTYGDILSLATQKPDRIASRPLYPMRGL